MKKQETIKKMILSGSNKKLNIFYNQYLNDNFAYDFGEEQNLIMFCSEIEKFLKSIKKNGVFISVKDIRPSGAKTARVYYHQLYKNSVNGLSMNPRVLRAFNFAKWNDEKELFIFPYINMDPFFNAFYDLAYRLKSCNIISEKECSTLSQLTINYL